LVARAAPDLKLDAAARQVVDGGDDLGQEGSKRASAAIRLISLFFTPDDLFAGCEVADLRGSRRASTGGRPMSD
jgi:hypothetical protein